MLTFPSAGAECQVPQVGQVTPPGPVVAAASAAAAMAGAEVNQKVEGGVCRHQQVVEGHQDVEPLRRKIGKYLTFRT